MEEAGRRAGVVVQSWREYGFLAAAAAWTDVINAAFDRHWGWNPISHEEIRPMIMPLQATPVADLSTIATIDGAAVGAVFAVPDLTAMLARLRPGVRLRPERGGATRGPLPKVGWFHRAPSPALPPPISPP